MSALQTASEQLQTVQTTIASMQKSFTTNNLLVRVQKLEAAILPKPAEKK